MPLNTFTVSFERTDTIQFVVDDDPKLEWLQTFDSSPYQRLFVFIDSNVRRIWGPRLDGAFREHGKQVFWLEIAPDESSKSLDFYPTVLAFLEEHGAGRFDLVLAVGGGIVVDLVSFLSSTYMRGLPFYAIPTTLVGQMDASTAGKTCLNTASAKNVLGTFYYPRVVYNNTRFLLTNTPYYLRQGYSEVFKYGLLRRPDLLELLEAHNRQPTDRSFCELVRVAIETRVSIRKEDPLASNLGHTFGHAIEKLSNFQILHGDAISAGTVMALRYAETKGLATAAAVSRVIDLMRRLNLNIFFDADVRAREMVRLMLRDKKSSASAIHLVLVHDVGVPYCSKGSYFYPADPHDVERFLEGYLSTSGLGLANCQEYLKREQLYRPPELP